MFEHSRDKVDIDGFLVINKPSGMTSHDVVLFVRRKFGIKKVGHTGILDPMATGVLILVLGKATKMTGILTEQNKAYQAMMYLGSSTHTQDKEGRVLKEYDITHLKNPDIINALMSFVGEIDQIPPMVSARRHKGKRLYELARKGIDVERAPKKIRIDEIRIDWIKMPYVSFHLRCSKGTYVRTLCHDVGEKLNVGAHLYALERTKSGHFTLTDAINWEELQHFSLTDLRERTSMLTPAIVDKIESSAYSNSSTSI